jgi:hypothetical protein
MRKSSVRGYGVEESADVEPPGLVDHDAVERPLKQTRYSKVPIIHRYIVIVDRHDDIRAPLESLEKREVAAGDRIMTDQLIALVLRLADRLAIVKILAELDRVNRSLVVQRHKEADVRIQLAVEGQDRRYVDRRCY